MTTMTTEEQKKIFSNNLNKYISRSGKQQKEIAEAIGTNASTFNMWCKGNSMPGTGKIRALADYFRIRMSDLDSNAMGASDKYKGKYLEITGKLSNIDAAGKYIDLMADGDFEIIGVQCYIKNDDQKAKVSSLTKGDTVTLKGKCTDVGEVLGYSLDIEEIE